jgi:NAD-dependent deacetylase
MVPLPKIGPGAEFAPLPVKSGERVFVLTGAGISAESGVRTFRDAGGLWYEHRLEDVATPEGFERDPHLVWRFYSERRMLAASVQPNPAHLALAKLEERIGERLFLCTQNVDSLHEKAGSREVLHMHGQLLATRCSKCDRAPFCDPSAYESPPRCDCGALLRPHVVWFGEMPFGLAQIYRALEASDLFLTVGSSGAVYPAAGFVSHLRHLGRARCVYVGLERPENAHSFDECRLGKAGELLPSLFRID